MPFIIKDAKSGATLHLGHTGGYALYGDKAPFQVTVDDMGNRSDKGSYQFQHNDLAVATSHLGAAKRRWAGNPNVHLEIHEMPHEGETLIRNDQEREQYNSDNAKRNDEANRGWHEYQNHHRRLLGLPPLDYDPNHQWHRGVPVTD
jgi:hypothetical protein